MTTNHNTPKSLAARLRGIHLALGPNNLRPLGDLLHIADVLDAMPDPTEAEAERRRWREKCGREIEKMAEAFRKWDNYPHSREPAYRYQFGISLLRCLYRDVTGTHWTLPEPEPERARAEKIAEDAFAINSALRAKHTALVKAAREFKRCMMDEKDRTREGIKRIIRSSNALDALLSAEPSSDDLGRAQEPQA